MAWYVTWNQTIFSTQFQRTWTMLHHIWNHTLDFFHHSIFKIWITVTRWGQEKSPTQPTEVRKTPTRFGPIGNATLNLWTCCWQAVLMFILNMEEQTMSRGGAIPNTINTQNTEDHLHTGEYQHYKLVLLTGSLVSGGLLTFFPRLSSWNCINWMTNADKPLLVGGSVCTYWKTNNH